MSYRAMPCSHPGCHDPASKRPIVIIDSRVAPERTARSGGDGNRFHVNFVGEDCYELQYEVVMQFCSHHAEQFNPRALMNEACWSAIRNQLAQLGYAPPDEDSVRVMWKAATGEDGLELQTFDDYEDDVLAQYRADQFARIRRQLGV